MDMRTKSGLTVPVVGLLCAVTSQEGERAFRGMMVYMADAPRFTDCETSLSYPMAQEGDYLAAERAYLDARSGPGEPVLMNFQGMLARRPGMEGGEVDAVVVTAFGGVDPGSGCGPEPLTGLLEGTEWRLVALPGAVDVPTDAVATLLLDPDGHRSSGSTGCNRFTGGYDLAGGRLTVSLSALTRMACPDPLATLEVDYLEALRGAGTYRFAGGLLELLGEAGPVARFAPPER
jgi:copper homeostasis protein (lipoprotein)